MAKSNLHAALSEDPYYRRYKTIVSEGTGSISLSAMKKEMDALHKSRKSRILYGSSINPKKLQEAFLGDLATRSRLTELKITLLDRVELIEVTTSALKVQVMTKYKDLLDELATNAQQRGAVLKRVVLKSEELLSEIEKTIKMIDLITQDIDQGAHSMRNALNCLQMVWSKNESM